MENLIELKKIACDYNVLIVEDSKHINSKLSEYLSKFFLEIDTAFDGEEALEKFNNKKHDIVVTDIHMPVIDGKVFVEYLTKNAPDVQVIIVSAFGYEDNIIAFNKYGIVDFIQKPINNIKLVDSLLTCIKNIKDITANLNISYSLDLIQYEKLKNLKELHTPVELLNSYKGVTVSQKCIITDLNEKTISIQTSNFQYNLIKCEQRTIISVDNLNIKANIQYLDKEKNLIILKKFETLQRSPKNRTAQRVTPDDNFTLTRHYKGETFNYKVSALSINSLSLKVPFEDNSFEPNSKADLVLGFEISYTKRYKASHHEKLLKPVKIRVKGDVLRIEKLLDGSKKIVFLLELNELSHNLLNQYVMQRETDILNELEAL